MVVFDRVLIRVWANGKRLAGVVVSSGEIKRGGTAETARPMATKGRLSSEVTGETLTQDRARQ